MQDDEAAEILSQIRWAQRLQGAAACADPAETAPRRALKGHACGPEDGARGGALRTLRNRASISAGATWWASRAPGRHHVQLDAGATYALSQVGGTIINMADGDQLVLKNVTLSTLPQGWIFTP